MPVRRTSSTVRSRGMVVLGAVLLTGLLVLTFAGRMLFGAAGGGNAGERGGAPAFAFPPPVASPTLGYVPTPLATPAPVVALAPGARAPIVCLDPGHGGPDRGFTRGPFDPLPAMEEATLNLEHAWDLEARLKQRGYGVVLTHRTDTAVAPEGEDVNGDGKTARDDTPYRAAVPAHDGTPEVPAKQATRYGMLDELQARINVCNAAHADLLVSMHINGAATSDPRGPETWYTAERPFGEQSRIFATYVYTNLKEQLAATGYDLPTPERGVNPDTVADVQTDHTIFKHFIITGPAVPGEIKPSEMPGAIVESLFISNDEDAAVLASPQGRRAIVNAYELAIVKYFERYPPKA